MAKIVRLKTPQNSVVEALEFLLERAKQGEIESFIFAAKKDGVIATSWANADVGVRQELVSHSQVDVMYAVVESNMDRLIESI